MKSYKARGIVLHTIRYGENAMVVFMLTDLLGRQNYMVQGIRGGKTRGNKAALFQPMFVVEFEGYDSPKMQMHRMRDIRAAVPLSSMPFDVRKSTIALFMAEVLYRLVKECEANSPLFGFIVQSIEALDGMQDGVSNFHLWFLVMISSHLGFYPGNEYTTGAWFDIKDGHFTPIMPAHRMALDQENTAILARLMETQPGSLADVKLTRERRSSFLSAMLSYFGYHLDAINQVRSVQILKEVF